MPKLHDKKEQPDSKLLNYLRKSKFKFFSSAMSLLLLLLLFCFFSSTYSFTVCADFSAGNDRIRNPTGYEGTRRKQIINYLRLFRYFKARNIN